MSQIETVIPCVSYDDFLSLTLRHNLPFLKSVTILTTPGDAPTIRLAKELDVKVFATDAWYQGGPLNKGHALNEWVAHASVQYPGAWLMAMDADILMYEEIEPHLEYLDPRGLYSVRRRMCETLPAFQLYLSGQVRREAFPFHTVPLKDGRLWGTIEARNPAGLSGYLQLWFPGRSIGASSFAATGTAEAYDLIFGLSFPERARRFLDPTEVLHIGPSETNWGGRRSPRWDLSGLRIEDRSVGRGKRFDQGTP